MTTEKRSVLIEKAVELGLSRKIAKKKSLNWLRLFVEVQTNEQSRRMTELGRAGLQAGATVRKNFGV